MCLEFTSRPAHNRDLIPSLLVHDKTFIFNYLVALPSSGGVALGFIFT